MRYMTGGQATVPMVLRRLWVPAEEMQASIPSVWKICSAIHLV